jgi:uncharacterized protein
MKYNPVGWFEIPVENMERAKKFYEELFEVKLSPMELKDYEMFAFPMEMKASGAGGAIMKGQGYRPGKGGTVVYFTSPKIDQTIERAKKWAPKLYCPKKLLENTDGFVGLRTARETQ